MTKSVITIPSNRIYLDTLSDAARQSLLHTMDCYNQAKEKLYNLKYDQLYLDKTIDEKETQYIKSWIYEQFDIKPQEYYITSLMSQTNGMIKSQQELQKLYNSDLEAKCENCTAKINKLFKRLRTYQNLKQKLIKLYKQGKAGKDQVAIPKYLKNMFPDTKDLKQLYELELYIDAQIKRISTRISMIQWKRERSIIVHKNIPARITFGGGKAFYKKKDTTNIDMDTWHEQRNFNRTRMILYSGRYDAKYKNWLCKYDINNKTMDITLMDGNILHLPSVYFPYREYDLRQVLSHPKETGYSVGYTIELRKDHLNKVFLLVKASFGIYDNHLNYDTTNGVISVDMNYDNISWSELDKHGNRLRGKSIYFDLEYKTSEQRKDILGRVSSRIIKLCVDTKKPLVIEDISMIRKKASMAYGNKLANQRVSAFAYKIISSLLYGKAFQNSVGVIKINPAYTSQIGKMKYMKRMKSTVHLAASYVIGRRGMGFSEKVPTYLKQLISDDKKRSHHWKQFSCLAAATKHLKWNLFLTELPDDSSNQFLTDVKIYKNTKYYI